jgi:hypothetical protein
MTDFPILDTVRHKHGQHDWHNHPAAEYAEHQQPIDNEVISDLPPKWSQPLTPIGSSGAAVAPASGVLHASETGVEPRYEPALGLDQCPAMTDAFTVGDGERLIGMRCTRRAGHLEGLDVLGGAYPGLEPRLHAITTNKLMFCWTDDELYCARYRNLRLEQEGPVPSLHTEPTGKAEAETAWLDNNGRVWVESGATGSRKLHLAGWANGIDVIHPDDGDHRDRMTPLYAPLDWADQDDDEIDFMVAKMWHETLTDVLTQAGIEPAGGGPFPSWHEVPHTDKVIAARVAHHVYRVLNVTFIKLRLGIPETVHDHDNIAEQLGKTIRERDSLARRLNVRFEELEKERGRLIAVDLAARGFWNDLQTILGNSGHPYWSPALDAVAALTSQPAASAAGRPDSYVPEKHTWSQPRPGVFVCLECPRTTPPDDEHGECAPWPCPGALEGKPALAHYNEYWPVGTRVQFRPNGVGDWTDSNTITPVWLGRDLQPYVSVAAYPPQAGAAVKIGDLRKIYNDGDGDDSGPLEPLGAVEQLDRYGM